MNKEQNINPEEIIGEKISFFQLFQKKGYNIEVPIIQRDYAQGRSSTSEIRESFLDTLYSHLDSRKPVDLDFIYGSIEDGENQNFIPLDGQQRLTTLFLLHWYTAQDEGKMEHFRNYLFDKKSAASCFYYKVRQSSTEFCNALMEANINLKWLLQADNGKQNALTKTIKDKHWFYLSWEQDPTIKSMLVMLDAIHGRFQGQSGFYEALTDSENPVITFQFLNLADFQLTDDLYIKMNARGKPLTPFENFKAKFEQHIKHLFGNQEVRLKFGEQDRQVILHEYFANKIDTEWADLFWNYVNPKTMLFDEQLMNFIRIMATNHYASKTLETNVSEGLKQLFGKEDPEQKGTVPPIPFSKFLELGCFDKQFAFDLVDMLDHMKNGAGKTRQYLQDRFYYNERAEFENIIKNELSYTQRVKFHAYANYFFTQRSTDGLSEWMRVIHNLSENTEYNTSLTFTRSIRGVDKMLEGDTKILQKLMDPLYQIEGFNERQINEERLKASLILSSPQWRERILTAEHHGYFKGQIGFLLSFSGISAYIEKNNNINWTTEIDQKMSESFDRYFSRAAKIFTDKGLLEMDGFAWERALLSKGDYLLQKGQNYSFLINSERDISWKRLLRGNDKADVASESRRNLVKELFDDPLFNSEKPEETLREVIAASCVKDWRKYFVEFPKLIGLCGNSRFIRFAHSGYSILLMEKTATNGAHREYYTSALSALLEKQFGATVSCFAENSVDEPKRISKINDQKIRIVYDWHANQWTYSVGFKDESLLFEQMEEVIDFLLQKGLLQKSKP